MIRNSIRLTSRLVWGTALILSGLAAGPAHAVFNSHPVCARLGLSLYGSQGLQAWCFGPQRSGPAETTAPAPTLSPETERTLFSPNVNAADLLEDITPGGVRAYGQSETSIAAAGPYVVEAWNDATGMLSPCPSPMNKEEVTALGFSNNGGASFTDLGGAPNADCTHRKLFGDPSVETYRVNGQTYFYISSVYLSVSFDTPVNALALTVCTVQGHGASATLHCGQPILAAVSSDCIDFFFCSLLDKEFLTIDPVRAKLYLSYTEFGVTSNFAGAIELAVCDLSDPAAPSCTNGSSAAPAVPYLTVHPGDICEREGAYPAVDTATGDVYVAHEFNLFSEFAPLACLSTPVPNVIARIPATCLTLPISSCGAPFAQAAVNIISLAAAPIAGYNRFPANDFPRIAVSGSVGTVSIVWNDARANPLGDILLQSFLLGSLTPVQAAPVKLNTDTTSALHFLPAVRNADGNGRLNVTWYDRRLHPNSALTDVFAALRVDPRQRRSPRANTRVTTVSSEEG